MEQSNRERFEPRSGSNSSFHSHIQGFKHHNISVTIDFFDMANENKMCLFDQINHIWVTIFV